jgi:hypothetical protein
MRYIGSYQDKKSQEEPRPDVKIESPVRSSMTQLSAQDLAVRIPF